MSRSAIKYTGATSPLILFMPSRNCIKSPMDKKSIRSFEILNNDKNINLYNPNLKRNFLYIEDFIKYTKKLLNSLGRIDKDYTEYYFASKEFNSLEEFINLIKKILKSRIYIKIYKGNLYKKTNDILMKEFYIKNNPKWIRLNHTINLETGLKKVIKTFLRGDTK